MEMVGRRGLFCVACGSNGLGQKEVLKAGTCGKSGCRENSEMFGSVISQQQSQQMNQSGGPSQRIPGSFWLTLQIIIVVYQFGGMMMSSLKLNTQTFIGREEEKKINQIISYLMDLPEAAEFLHPVDWEELELNDYPLVVKHPMNLLKVQDKIRAREYRTIEEALDHIQMVWDNCKAYNPEGQYYVLADKMERHFKKMIRNYLPNIQVVVPKPVGSSNPVPDQKPIAIPPTRTHTKAPIRQSNPQYSQPSLQLEEPISANDQAQVGQCEEVPLSEKNRLQQRLKQLTQQQLAQVVYIIQEGCSEGFKELGGGRSQLLLDHIDPDTFKRANLRIDELLEGEKTSNKKIKL